MAAIALQSALQQVLENRPHRRACARQRDDHDLTTHAGGKIRTQLQAIGGHALTIALQRVIEQLHVLGSGQLLRGQHLAVVARAALDQLFFVRNVVQLRQLDRRQQELDIFGTVAAVETHGSRSSRIAAIWLRRGDIW